MSQAFLVVLRCTMDDLPIRLHAEYGPALVQAQELGLRLKALGDGEILPAEVSEVEDVLGLDASSFHSVCILEFQDGHPVSNEQIVDLT